jgi:large subunit ribosomal protein L5
MTKDKFSAPGGFALGEKKIEKISVNTGFGRLAGQVDFEKKILPELTRDFSLITGQKPAFCPAKQSISGFKLRKGAIIGLKTTLRGKRMKDFLEKINHVVLPRVRDFQGINLKSIDKNGNLSIGIKECVVFPEISPETLNVNFGIEITIVPKAVKSRNEAIELYRELGVPLKGLVEKFKPKA